MEHTHADGGSTTHDGNERELPENSVEYLLFIVEDNLDTRKLVSQLDGVRKAAVQLSQTLAADYIWQRDEFNLQIKNETGLVYLHGVTDYGDAVEDEWLIVYMLRELTRTHPNLWARVADADGEFLLVEAANVLPKWLSPETDRNRVWIHDGKLLIIPSGASSHTAGPPGTVSLPEAVYFIKARHSELVNSSFVESEAFYRLERYPAQVADSLHHSLVTIPRKLAYILHSLPRSVAPAVEAFYLRDPVGLRPIVSSSAPLQFPPEDLVTTSLRFSRVLFAQLRSQRFETPPRWKDALQGAGDKAAEDEEARKSASRLEMGMKLTCGFEMLAAKAEQSKSRVVREVAIVLQDIQEDGAEALPTDEEIGKWRDSRRDDDEAWMDINYEDFERELEGKRAPPAGQGKSGFGDARTQEDLRKIVSRFEAFLNDEGAGLEGAELDDMAMDNDDEDSGSGSEDDDSELEDKDVSFDEDEFSRMMREMMGLPSADASGAAVGKGKAPARPEGDRPAARDQAEGAQIQELSSQMEAELKGHGALKLDAPTDKRSRLQGAGEGSKQPGPGAEEATGANENDSEEEDGEGEVDIDYNLAKNLLESFKSQGGTAGPTGNLLGMMGFQLPRDEDDGKDGPEQAADGTSHTGK